jgi:hypothetical protein
MANVHKPLLRSHHFIGEDEAHDLIVWMNCNEYRQNRRVTPKDRRPAFQRMHRVLELAREVESTLVVHAATSGRLAPQLITELRLLNCALARYTFRPHFPDPPRFFLVWRSPNPEQVIPSEHRAVLSLTKLLELRLLDRIRSCSQCTTWFFARYRHSKFCKTVCQQKHYALSPEFRDARRTYMREYRRKHGY